MPASFKFLLDLLNALDGFTIDNEVRAEFQEVKELVKNGDKARVKSIYPNTFWAYYF